MTRIQEIRKLFELTQSEFAFYLNITQGTYSQYESGRDIPRKYYPALEKMGVNISWLLSGEGEPVNAEKYSQFKKMQDNSEVKVVDARLSPNVVLPFLRLNFRQSFSRGSRVREKTIITREDEVDYSGALILESGNENMEPTVLAGEKLLCMPAGNINYVTGVVLVVLNNIVLIRRIKSNGAGNDVVVLESDNGGETISVRKVDILNMYKVVMSVGRPIS